MSKTIPPLGSRQWAAQVFSSPPVAPLKGHAKRTQCHIFASAALGQLLTVQGRNEFYAALAIEHLVRVGFLNRAKAQPFQTDEGEFGMAIRPDFLVEPARTQDAAYYVIEAKSARFLTRRKSAELEYIRERFSTFNIRYLVWTDAFPLNAVSRHHLLSMRQYDTAPLPPSKLKDIESWLSTPSPRTLGAFYAAGYGYTDLYAAAVRGILHFRLTAPFTAETQLHKKPTDDLWHTFMGKGSTLEQWWDSLPR